MFLRVLGSLILFIFLFSGGLLMQFSVVGWFYGGMGALIGVILGMVFVKGYAVLLTCFLVFLVWKLPHFLKERRGPRCKVSFDWREPCSVGNPVSFRVALLNQGHGHGQNDPKPTSYSSILRDVSVSIRHVSGYHTVTGGNTIAFVREVDEESGEIIVKFSTRLSGLYVIAVNYKGIRADGSPFRKRFKPTGLDPSKTIFLRPSPTLVCVSGEESQFEIQPKDKYGNNCDDGIWSEGEQGVLDRLKFVTQFGDESRQDFPVSKKLLSHVFIATPTFSNNVVYNSRIELVVCVTSPGVFKGQICYDEKPITNGQFDILCATQREIVTMKEIASGNPAWTPHSCDLLSIGEVVQTKKKSTCAYVSPKLFYIEQYWLKIFPMKLATYRVSPLTKINILRVTTESAFPSSKTHGDIFYTFSIADTIQPKVTVQMEASKARILLSLYYYFLQKRLGGCENFEGKQRVFHRDLQASVNDLRVTTHQICVSRPNLVYSSMKVTKSYRRGDWCKNFGIKFENENGVDYGGLRKEWLELLCVQFFQDNPNGMFSSVGNSRLVHPNSSSVRYPLWSLAHYEFAGKVGGKCLYESSCGDTYAQTLNAKFTRSFLAQVLGLPPNYQHFQEDDPELYVSKVKYLLEHDVTDMELTFSEEEYDANGKLAQVVDLIPKGSQAAVTQENKEQYLNALAQYRLGAKVSKEIEAFRRGLHYIVPEELLNSFDENELELLMCGKSEFNIEDLKQNHLQDFLWGPTSNKLYIWFCTAVSNMSDDERGRLLQFTTGTSILPLGGFKSLAPKFKISISNEYGKLPKAHTCFNTICLSDHNNYESFEKSLRTAITEGSEGFGFA